MLWTTFGLLSEEFGITFESLSNYFGFIFVVVECVPDKGLTTFGLLLDYFRISFLKWFPGLSILAIRRQHRLRKRPWKYALDHFGITFGLLFDYLWISSLDSRVVVHCAIVCWRIRCCSLLLLDDFWFTVMFVGTLTIWITMNGLTTT